MVINTSQKYPVSRLTLFATSSPSRGPRLVGSNPIFLIAPAENGRIFLSFPSSPSIPFLTFVFLLSKTARYFAPVLPLPPSPSNNRPRASSASFSSIFLFFFPARPLPSFSERCSSPKYFSPPSDRCVLTVFPETIYVAPPPPFSCVRGGTCGPAAGRRPVRRVGSYPAFLAEVDFCAPRVWREKPFVLERFRY